MRTPDAIHLAILERLAGVIERIVVVSTNSRVRANAQALGFTVAPG